MNEEILRTIREKGLLLEKEIFDLLQSFQDSNSAKMFLENLERISGQKVITKSVLTKNIEYVQQFVSKLPGQDKDIAENVIVKLGLSLEITKEKEIVGNKEEGAGKKEKGNEQSFQIFYADTKNDKKLEVADFT